MTGFVRKVGLWGPPLVVMAAIFAFSSNPAASGHHSLLVFLGRNAGHLTGYALLMLTLWRALDATVGGRRAAAFAYAITIAYAATDEYHQTFVRNRVGTWHDVAIDGAGALIGVALVLLVRRLRRSRDRRPRSPQAATG